MPDEQVVNQGQPDPAPSALEQAIASSPEAMQEVKEQIQQSQEAQTPTAEKGVAQEPDEQQEELRIPYSRFKEKVDEANWLKQQLELRNQQFIPQQPQQQAQQIPQEIGNTPEEREFWRMQRQIAREEGIRAAQEQLGQIQPVIDAGRHEIARIGVKLFRNEFPDIKPNSPEEAMIAEKISTGISTEDAYKLVMWDKKFADVKTQAKQEVKQQIAAKKQANLETKPSIPQQAQTKPKMSFRDEFMKNYEVEESKP